jgi:hypothetical protein
MTLVDFVTQFWVLLLSFAVVMALLLGAIGMHAVWKAKQDKPEEMDEALRQRLQERLRAISEPQRKTA